MAVQGTNSVMQPPIPAVRGVRSPLIKCQSMIPKTMGRRDIHLISSTTSLSKSKSSRGLVPVFALDGGASLPPVPNSNYVVPMDLPSSFSCITRTLAEILRDLNKRIPDNIVKRPSTLITWYHANRMLSFYAPGWCGEIRDVIFSDSGSVTVVYRVTIRGSDGEAHRESTGTVLSGGSEGVNPVAAAEELAFCRACARFGLGLYLYHEE